MHPHLLHALAACWSLLRALEALEALAREALADAEAGSRDGDVPIRSQRFGHRTALGGHGDPTADTAMQALSAPWQPPNPYAVMRADQLGYLDEKYGHWPGAPGMDPLRRVQQAIPLLPPDVAKDVAEDLANMDRHARKQLQTGPGLQFIDGQCPACRVRGLLYVQTSAPAPERTVVCRNSDCTCSGDGCPCGMPIKVEGVGHIWDRTATFVTTALTTTNQPS